MHKGRLLIDLPKWKQDFLPQLEEELSAVLDFYYSKGCPCQFPRFRQFAAIDCLELGGSFYCYESNLLIEKAILKRFDLGLAKKEATGGLLVSCKVCQSTYRWDAEEFGFAVQWMVLRLEEKKSRDIGAPTKNILPVFIGPIGYEIPSTPMFEESLIKEVIDYLIA